MIELKHIRKEYESSTPLRDVSVTINDGDIISVIGPSGTGKSTLLRCINLLEMPTSGEIWVDGEKVDTASQEEVTRHHRKIGMVFQSFNLFENLTVIENIMLPQMEILGRSKQDAYEKAMSLLDEVGLWGKELRYPEELSGGQKQRVAIARTLAMDTEMILFDEPTSALDPSAVNEVLITIMQLAKKKKTMLIVTHELTFARQVSNRVFYMDEGGIYEDGSPEQIFEKPLGEKTRQFVRRSNILELSIQDAKYDYQRMISDIYQYGYKYRLSKERCNLTVSIFEELCQNILIEEMVHRGQAVDIRITVENETETGKVMMTMKYKGNIDPKHTDNDLAIRIVEMRTNAFEYKNIADEEYTDQIKLEIK